MRLEFKFPKRLPEANIQAAFYMRCREESFPCILEYKIKGSRFDAVIHNKSKIICIVEVKNMSEHALQRRLSGKRKYAQIERYSQYGIPVIRLWNADFIEPTIKTIKELMHG